MHVKWGRKIPNRLGKKGQKTSGGILFLTDPVHISSEPRYLACDSYITVSLSPTTMMLLNACQLLVSRQT